MSGPATPESLARRLATLPAGQRLPTQGLTGAARGHVLAHVARTLNAPLICVTADEEAADQLTRDLAFFLGGPGELLSPRVLQLPGDEALPYDEVVPDAALRAQRLGALHHLRRGTPFPALVVSWRALQRKVLPARLMDDLSERIVVGEERNRDALALKLTEMGFFRAPLVEDVGTFSIRGDIVDIYPPLYDQPLRIELFGDSVESIRAFDPENQRTVATLKEARISPARELLFNDTSLRLGEAATRDAADRVDLPSTKLRERLDALRERIPSPAMDALLPGFYEGGLSSVFDYLSFWQKDAVVYLDDPVALDRVSSEAAHEVAHAYEAAVDRDDLTLPPDEHFLSPDEIRAGIATFRAVEGGGLTLHAGETPMHFSFGGTQDLRDAILAHHGEEGALAPLVERLRRWRDLGVACAVACGTAGQADRLKRLLADRDVSVRVHKTPYDPTAPLYDPALLAHLFPADISKGFVDTTGALAVLSDEEIFGARAKRRAKGKSGAGMKAFGAAFRDLKNGDLVVHEDFGVARYAGLTKMQVQGIPGDFLILEYAGKDKVYLPVSRMRLIQKFSGGDPDKVALDRLGTASWENTKRRVKENLLKMAAELLQLYAARKAHPGAAFSAPDPYFRQFEADFEFDETPDQAKAIDDVLADMQKPEPMDRLICGDVGYGKTEVAMRAAFKATMDKKQVAVLAPTTVLAQQHFHTFRRRFKDYPVNVEVISRMRKPDEVRETLRRAREGGVDILIGTHKLLGADVAFKDLGLLVVDEEQRFGVKHKEQLKKLRAQVDVLTLTATPIPRTLHMSMSGIRDMSIIASPPEDRRAIRTFVIKFEPTAIRDAIRREIQRGGQVFFVHNRVQSIHSMDRFLKELVPEATIGVAHGQMGEGQLEKVMTDFVDRKFQVLLCTSIIESGIDIPSANTMIVNRADSFGLAQLYQLRGRVGRSKERAYAYLLAPANRAVTKDAQRRLEVLQAFTELGAGFTIASHDLEIRGAGSLLGEAQSGAIAAIGFDLYTQLLSEAVAEMRGEPPAIHVEPEVTLPLPALIPDDYVPDVHQRLVLYKRFSIAPNPNDITDLRSELVDRFGETPPEVDNLAELMLLKIDMRDLRLRSLEAGPGRLVVTLGPDALLDAAQLAVMVQASKGAYRLTPEMKLIVRLPEGKKDLLPEAKRVIRDLRARARER